MKKVEVSENSKDVMIEWGFPVSMLAVVYLAGKRHGRKVGRLEESVNSQKMIIEVFRGERHK